MGTLEASYLMTLGGNIPGGRMRSMVCDDAVTCAIAISTLALGWKIYPDDRDAVVGLDSMCSMSFTVVVMARSKMVTMRFSISSGERPV